MKKLNKVVMNVSMLRGRTNAGVGFFFNSDDKRIKSIAIRMVNLLYKYAVVNEVSDSDNKVIKEFLMTDLDLKLFLNSIEGLKNDLKSLKKSLLSNYENNLKVFEDSIKDYNKELLEITLESIPTKQDIEKSFYCDIEVTDYYLSEDEKTKTLFIDKFIKISKDLAQSLDKAIAIDKVTLMKQLSIGQMYSRLKELNVFSIPEFEFCNKPVKFEDIDEITSLFLNLSDVIDSYNSVKEKQVFTEVIKEYCSDSKVCVIRTNTYNHTAKYFKDLIAEAKKDFPYLTDNNIEIIHFAGIRYKGTFGIEFSVTEEPKEEYLRIKELEYLL